MADDDDGGALGALHRAMDEVMSRAREEKRPRIEDVVRVVDGAFRRMAEEGDCNVQPLTYGPPSWSWGDRTMIAQGFDRVYTLTESILPGLEGYPLMSVRQVIAPHFDAQLTVSTLIMGPDDDAISRSCAMLLTNHAAAFQGLRGSITTMARHGTDVAIEQIKRTKRETDGMDLSDVIPKKGEMN